jgi:C1A family cysteine protease
MKRYPFAALIVTILVAFIFTAQFVGAAAAAGASSVPGGVQRPADNDGGPILVNKAPVAAPATTDGITRKMGVKRSPGEASAHRLSLSSLSSSASTNLPSAADIAPPSLPIGSQGNQGSCVGWAVGYYFKTIQEYYEHRWDVSRTDREFSPAWVYNQINGGRDQGASFYAAFNLLKNSGAVDLAEFPYHQYDYKTQPDSVDKEAAKPYRITDSATLWYSAGGNDVRQIKACLADGQPVALGITVYDSFYYCVGPWVDTPAPSESNYGDHAVCAVGYDDRAGGGKGGIKIANSWGSGWGDGGCTYLSYDFVANYCWEAWVATDRPSDRPTVTSMTPVTGRAGGEVTITGDNFGAKRAASAVSFRGLAGGSGMVGALMGGVTNWSNTSIRVRVPIGAMDGLVRAVNWAGEQSNGTAFAVELSLSSVEPGIAKGGDRVSIRGMGLGSKAGQVKLGSSSLQVLSWKDSEIVFHAPATPRSGDLTACVDGRISNSLPFSVVGSVWYLAEGSTGAGFETWVLVQNPNSEPAKVRLTYMTASGKVDGPVATLAPDTRMTFNVADTVPGQYEVSTKVVSNRPVVAERAMYGNNRKWGHDSIGAQSPAGDWYLAEGSTADGFETWVLVQNPNDSAARVSLTYMTAAGPVAGPTIALAANSRKSFNVADTVANQYEVSTKVTSDRPVVAERAMYWGGRTGGHDSIGATSPEKVWYLAEGATGPGFETWVLVQNPGDSDARVRLTYMTDQGTVAGPELVVGARTRRSVSVADTVPGNWNVSTMVSSDVPVVAERAVYWNNRIEGHDSVGVTRPARSWMMPNGATNGGFETWVLVQNPNDSAARVALTYMTPAGPVAGPDITLPPRTRKSFNVADTVAGQWEISTAVRSDKPVVAECSMYGNGRAWGTDSVGSAGGM